MMRTTNDWRCTIDEAFESVDFKDVAELINDFYSLTYDVTEEEVKQNCYDLLVDCFLNKYSEYEISWMCCTAKTNKQGMFKLEPYNF